VSAMKVKGGTLAKYLPRLPKRRPVVSVLQLEGIIQSGGRMQSRSLNDAGLTPIIEKCFRKGRPKAVAIKVNSPGGSPAQSSLIAAQIRRLAKEKEIPVYAFVEDLAVSGGYWLASAADEIYVDPNSTIGSIGVVYASFGFHELLHRHGIDRRVHTAGEDKSILDPFRPENPDHVDRLRELQDQIHGEFIDYVQSRRGDKLIGENLFTGRFWIGRTAVELGLADGVGHLIPEMKKRFGDTVRFRHYGKRRNIFGGLGTAFTDAVLDSVEERLIRSRYGL